MKLWFCSSVVLQFCSSSQQQGAVLPCSVTSNRLSPQEDGVSSLPSDIQHGVDRFEAEFLGERTEARPVLLFPRRQQQQRVGSIMRAGQTHTVSDLLR